MSMNENIDRKLYTVDVTIASGQTTSSAVDLSGATLVAIDCPATVTGTALSFTCSTSKTGTYIGLYDDEDNPITVTISSNARRRRVFPEDFASVNFLELVSNANEAADRSFTLICRPLA